MTRSLILHKAGPAMSIQDLGRPGFLAYGLTRGGAMDSAALHENAALLGQSASDAAIEMAASGGVFEAACDLRIALTGAVMRAQIDGENIAWNACHHLLKGKRLTIGPAVNSNYGYLGVGGGFTTPERLGKRGAHLGAGLGGVLEDGAVLPVGIDRHDRTGVTLQPLDRFGDADIRLVPSFQTKLFPQALLDRFINTQFTRDLRGNRMGVRLNSSGEGFSLDGNLSLLSEVVVPGDVQITGDGTPYVLVNECQSMGGYPRIGTIIPSDLNRLAQLQAGNSFAFRFVTLEEALAVEHGTRATIAALAKTIRPLIRDPHDIADLLSYQLISGVISANEEEIPT